jgi:uncharacterized protein YqjF (DUF2071 family)
MISQLPPTDHRPWPLPSSPWVMRQKWHDLLFMHWRIPPQTLRPLVPAALELDHFEGSAWLGVVPFRMTGVRLRGTPAIPGLSAFPELNVRTYVSAGGKPGVWFFSLDAASAIAVAAARAWFHLPYFRARMSLEAHGDEIRYQSHRTHRICRGRRKNLPGRNPSPTVAATTRERRDRPKYHGRVTRTRVAARPAHIAFCAIPRCMDLAASVRCFLGPGL